PAAALPPDILDAGLDQLSPLLDEVPGMGLHQRTRIADHRGLGPVDGTDQVLRQSWLAGTQPWCAEYVEPDTEPASILTGLGNALFHCLSSPVQLQPAALAYQIPGTGGLDHGAMGVLAALDQRCPFPHDTLVALATGIEPVLEQRNRGIQHARRPVADIHLAI